MDDNEFVFFFPDLAQDANYVENAFDNFSDNLDLVVDVINKVKLNVNASKTDISDVSIIGF